VSSQAVNLLNTVNDAQEIPNALPVFENQYCCVIIGIDNVSEIECALRVHQVRVSPCVILQRDHQLRFFADLCIPVILHLDEVCMIEKEECKRSEGVPRDNPLMCCHHYPSPPHFYDIDNLVVSELYTHSNPFFVCVSIDCSYKALVGCAGKCCTNVSEKNDILSPHVSES